MIEIMGSAAGAGAVVGGVAGRGAGGVVDRPRLFGRLAMQARVSVVSAPAGSGKTVLLRSWISLAGVARSAAWVPTGRGERDPPRFWLSVLTGLRETAVGAALVQPLTAAPSLDGWALVERLLADLASLDDQLWLVVDDVHELGAEALAQLELLIMRAAAPHGANFAPPGSRATASETRPHPPRYGHSADDLRHQRAEAKKGKPFDDRHHQPHCTPARGH